MNQDFPGYLPPMYKTHYLYQSLAVGPLKRNHLPQIFNTFTSDQGKNFLEFATTINNYLVFCHFIIGNRPL